MLILSYYCHPEQFYYYQTLWLSITTSPGKLSKSIFEFSAFQFSISSYMLIVSAWYHLPNPTILILPFNLSALSNTLQLKGLFLMTSILSASFVNCFLFNFKVLFFQSPWDRLTKLFVIGFFTIKQFSLSNLSK